MSCHSRAAETSSNDADIHSRRRKVDYQVQSPYHERLIRLACKLVVIEEDLADKDLSDSNFEFFGMWAHVPEVQEVSVYSLWTSGHLELQHGTLGPKLRDEHVRMKVDERDIQAVFFASVSHHMPNQWTQAAHEVHPAHEI